MSITFDVNLLTAYYQAKSGLSANTSASTTGAGGTKKATPTAPWSTSSEAPRADALVKSVLQGAKFVNEGATKVDVPGANGDYKKLFALYQGLNALEGLAEQIQAKGVGDTEKARMRATFDRGMAEVSAYLDNAPFKGFSVALGAVAAKVQTAVGTKRPTDGYQTAPLAKGTLSDPVAAFAGPTVFSMTVQKTNSTQTINFDLSEMGATPRTMSNVVMYMNDKLLTAGVNTRFANVRIPGQPITTTAGKQTITLGTAPDSFALKIKTDTAETISFQAPAAAPAVYVGGQSGGVTGSKNNPVQQITKFEAGGTSLSGAAADGKVSTKTLGSEVLALKQSVTAADGSVYMLAEVQGGVDGEKLKSTHDLALLKYDSAGALVFSRSLGAAGEAGGYALALSADGKSIAIGGQVVGKLDAGDIPADPKAADSFVTVYNDQGEEQWTQRAVATGDDRVNALAFAADGSLYATGTTAGGLFGQSAIGGPSDGYIRGYSATGKVTFSSPYGTTGGDKGAGIVVDGSSIVVAGVEGGEAVLRRYDLQPTGAPVLASTRNLGALGGGSIAGITLAADGSLIVAGTTGAALSAGAVTTAYDGAGKAGFIANLASNLSSSGADRLTYLDAGKDKTLTAFSLSSGKVYVTGQQTITPPPGQTVASHDGYVAAVDPRTGAVSWSTSFRGVDYEAAPTTIAVAQTGASVLDRLGLPTGIIDTTPSDTLVANTGVRAGDQFTIRVGGIAKKITIEATDTLKTLASKINRASQFYATATVLKVDGMDQLKIVPAMKNADIEIEPGKLGADALRALGLTEGLVTNDPTSARDALKVKGEASYGLGLSGIANLATDASSKQAASSLLAAATALRQIYNDLVKPPTLADSKPASAPSAYMTAKIADYQLALARLGG